MRPISVKQFVAITPLHFSKVEAKIQSGIATIAQKRDVIQVDLVMDYEYEGTRYYAGHDKAILHGDAALQAWNKQALNLDGKEFVLCPVSAIIGFVSANPPLIISSPNPLQVPGYSPFIYNPPPSVPQPPYIVTCKDSMEPSQPGINTVTGTTSISYEGLK